MNALYPELAIGMPGTSELIIIAIFMLLFFGPKRLPELARSIGGAITSFKEGLNAKPSDDDKRVGGGSNSKPASDAGKDGAGA